MNAMPDTPTRLTAVRLIHYGVIVLLILGAAAYWILKPSTLNPMADANAAQALALVQTHRAHGAPTILQAITREAADVAQRGRRVKVGEWTVSKQKGDSEGRIYVVRLEVREKGTAGWIEREYLWQADIIRKRIFAVSVPAQFVMPLEEGAR